MRAGQLRAVAAAALALVVLGGCGDSSSDETTTADAPGSASPSAPASTPPQVSDSPSASPTDTGLPACADVWSVGARMPQHYRGCEQKGEAVRAEARPCESGRSLVTFDKHFFAVEGGTVDRAKTLLADPAYKKLLAHCTA